MSSITPVGPVAYHVAQYARQADADTRSSQAPAQQSRQAQRSQQAPASQAQQPQPPQAADPDRDGDRDGAGGIDVYA